MLEVCGTTDGVCCGFVDLEMFEEIADCGFSLGLDSLLIEIDLEVGCTISFGFFDLNDPSLLSEYAENGIGSSNVCLHPFIMLDIVVLESSHSSEDEVEPTQVNDIPAFFLGEFGQESGLHVLEEREVKSHTVGLAFFVEGCDLAEDAAPGLVRLVEGSDFLSVEGRREVWFFVIQAT